MHRAAQPIRDAALHVRGPIWRVHRLRDRISAYVRACVRACRFHLLEALVRADALSQTMGSLLAKRWLLPQAMMLLLLLLYVYTTVRRTAACQG